MIDIDSIGAVVAVPKEGVEPNPTLESSITTPYGQIRHLVEEVYLWMFPNETMDVKLNLISERELRQMDDRKRVGGLCIRHPNGKKNASDLYVHVEMPEYQILKIIGHELGHAQEPFYYDNLSFKDTFIHLFTSRFMVLEEAKAMIFANLWQKTIIKHNIGGHAQRLQGDCILEDILRVSNYGKEWPVHDRAYHLARFAQNKYPTFRVCCKHLRELAESKEFERYYVKQSRDLSLTPFF